MHTRGHELPNKQNWSSLDFTQRWWNSFTSYCIYKMDGELILQDKQKK
jgi:hypothetical protein